MKYRIELDVLVDTELNAVEFLNAVEYLKALVTKPRNAKDVPTERKCTCMRYKDNSNVGTDHDSVDFDAPRKIHNDSGQAG